MSAARRVQLVAGIVAVLSLTGAGLMIGPINTMRRDLQLSLAPEVGESVPPDVALATAALGSFRGLFIDILWYRANRLQEDGKYFEANQLSQFITKLQPRFGMVWGFQAWNMAYNISVATTTPQERWDWVNKGITLLRDRGIPFNHNNIRLYRELGWIFFHKVGQFSDDMHWYYKQQLAYEWHELLGDMNLGATTEQAIATFKEVVDAPATLEALLAARPGVAPLVERLRATGATLDIDLVRQYGRYRMFLDSIDARVLGITPQRLPRGTLNPDLVPLFQDPTTQEDLRALITHLRRVALERNYHMQPGFMLELMEKFGPIDWRHPAAHGAYWSALGVVRFGDLRRTTGVDGINTDRQVMHSLQSLEHMGRVSFDPISGYLDLMPDPRFIPAYEQAVELAYQRIEEGVYRSTTQFTYASGHENFLLKAIYDYYLYGDISQAQHYYQKVRERYGHLPHNLSTGRYLQPLTDLVLSYIDENWDMMANARQFIQAMLFRGFSQGLSNGRYEVFQRYVDLATRIHERYHERRNYQNVLATQGRVSLVPMPQLIRDTYIDYMTRQGLPLQARARIWHLTPDDLRRGVWDRLAPVLYEQAALGQIDPAAAFPEPEGMKEQREALMQRLAEKFREQNEALNVERK